MLQEMHSFTSDVDYSDTDSDQEENERFRRAEEERMAKKCYQGFNLESIFRCMQESGHKVDKHYELGENGNWRLMWDSSLHILGKHQYHIVPKNVSNAKIKKSNSKSKISKDGSASTTLPAIDDRSTATSSLAASTKRMETLNEKTRRANERREKAREAKQREIEMKNKHKEEIWERFHLPPTSSIKGVTKYGALSNNHCEVSLVLRKIGKGLRSISPWDRKELVSRGTIDLLNPTSLRTRLDMFLNVSITPNEVSLIFKKFDPNDTGTVNMADLYGNAMGTLKKRKKKMKQQTNLLSPSSRTLSTTHSPNRSFVVNNKLNQKINPLGQLDGDVHCSVSIDPSVPDKSCSESDCHMNDGESEYNDMSNKDYTSELMRHDKQNANEYTRIFDCFPEPPTPEHGMGTTQNVSQFNTLAESDSCNDTLLCCINEEITEDKFSKENSSVGMEIEEESSICPNDESLQDGAESIEDECNDEDYVN